MGAMLDMMGQMMGKQPGNQPGQGNSGDTPGEGGEGTTDQPNNPNEGNADGNKEERRFEKASGRVGDGLPEEFRKALDAYNNKR